MLNLCKALKVFIIIIIIIIIINVINNNNYYNNNAYRRIEHLQLLEQSRLPA